MIAGILAKLAGLAGGPAVSAVFAFATSRAGKFLLIGAGVIAALLVAYVSGFRDASARCRTRALQAENAALKRDLAIQQDTAEFSRRQQAAIEQVVEELNTKVADYEASRRKGIACPLGADDVRRLQSIR